MLASSLLLLHVVGFSMVIGSLPALAILQRRYRAAEGTEAVNLHRIVVVLGKLPLHGGLLAVLTGLPMAMLGPGLRAAWLEWKLVLVFVALVNGALEGRRLARRQAVLEELARRPDDPALQARKARLDLGSSRFSRLQVPLIVAIVVLAVFKP